MTARTMLLAWVGVIVVALMLAGLVYLAVKMADLDAWCRELGWDGSVLTADGGRCVEYHRP